MTIFFKPINVLFLVGITLLITVPSPVPIGSSDDRSLATTKTPIKHFIVLMQEGHTFDNYFGRYPGADGIPAGTCMPKNNSDPKNTDCVKPFHLGESIVTNLDHDGLTYQHQYNNGMMDGFVSAFVNSGKDGTLAMGYYDDRDLPLYWNIADNYVLFDRFFSSAASGNVKNYMYWLTGSPGNEQGVVPREGWGNIPTIFDRLENAGISWKFYVQNYAPKLTFRNRPQSTQVTRVPLMAYDRFLDNPALFRHIVPLDEYYKDLQNGTLPAVSYVVSLNASEQAPGSISAGQRLVKNMLNALMQSDAWASSAFILSYGSWGGWYDHVPPPHLDDHGYGFRVPALLISSYARKGHIDNTQLDFTSLLRFIEFNWNLQPLAERDAKSNTIVGAFDFAQPPREPSFISSIRSQIVNQEPRRIVIKVAYSTAILLSTFVIAWAFLNSRTSVTRSSESVISSKDRGAV